MKKIKMVDYQESMGPLIDLSSPVDFWQEHHEKAKNIPYQKFMLYYDHLLKKETPYFLTCAMGVHSAKAVRLLEYLGYNVTQVVK